MTRCRSSVGLARRSDAGWAFSHGLLVESIARRCEAAGTWAAHHRRCVQVLERCYPDQPRNTAARRAEHWIAAGELEEALPALFEEQTRRWEAGETGAQRNVLRQIHELMEAIGVPPGDVRWLEHAVEAAHCDLEMGAAPEVITERVERALRQVEADAPGPTSRALQLCAKVREREGDLAAARQLSSRAVAFARQADDPALLVRALGRRGWAEFALGNLDRADELLGEAAAMVESLDEPYLSAVVTHQRAQVSVARGEVERSEKLLSDVLNAARTAGFRQLEALCLNSLGETARFSGDAERARRLYDAFRQISEEIGDEPQILALAHSNLALADLMSGRFRRAGEHLDACRALYQAHDTDQATHTIRLATAAVRAGLGDWDGFDALVDSYGSGWPRGAGLERDHPWLLDLLARLADSAGRAGRAEDLRALAGTLRARLDGD